MPDVSADALVVGFTGHPYNPDPAHGPNWYPRTHDTLLGAWGYYSSASINVSGYYSEVIWILARYIALGDPDPYSFYIADSSTGLELADADKPNVEAVMVRVKFDGIGHGIGYDYSAVASAGGGGDLLIPSIGTFGPSTMIAFADVPGSGVIGSGFSMMRSSPESVARKVGDGTDTGDVHVSATGGAGVGAMINVQHGEVCADTSHYNGSTAAYQTGGIYSDYLLDLPPECVPVVDPTPASYGSVSVETFAGSPSHALSPSI